MRRFPHRTPSAYSLLRGGRQARLALLLRCKHPNGITYYNNMISGIAANCKNNLHFYQKHLSVHQGFSDSKHAQGGEAGGVRADGLHEIAAVLIPEAHQTQRFAKGSLVVVIDVEFPGRPLL